MTHEQVVHDRINLVRLVRRLEQSVADEQWESQHASEESQHNSYMFWIKAQGTLQVWIKQTSICNCYFSSAKTNSSFVLETEICKIFVENRRIE
jgi:hypothetical protein